MIRPSPWPELDRLARFVRASDSLTETLALWTGRGLTVEILRQVDDASPDPLVADLWISMTARACRTDRCSCGAATSSWPLPGRSSRRTRRR